MPPLPASRDVILPTAVALSSVALGVVLAVRRGSGESLGLVRTFALTASGGLLLLHLLPDALQAIGLWAPVLFLVGAVVPRLLDRHGDPHAPDAAEHGGHLGLELSYLGLLVHSAGDGAALGSYSGAAHRGHVHLDVLAAIAAHTVPVVAVLTLAYEARRGRRAALLRALGVALATVAGIAATSLVSEANAEAAQGWVAAAVSGMLLHVVSHELDQDLPQTNKARALDLAVGALGVAVTLFAGHSETIEHEAHAGLEFGDVVWELARWAAPILALVTLVWAFWRSSGRRELPRELQRVWTALSSWALWVVVGAAALITAAPPSNEFVQQALELSAGAAIRSTQLVFVAGLAALTLYGFWQLGVRGFVARSKWALSPFAPSRSHLGARSTSP